MSICSSLLLKSDISDLNLSVKQYFFPKKIAENGCPFETCSVTGVSKGDLFFAIFFIIKA